LRYQGRRGETLLFPNAFEHNPHESDYQTAVE